MAYVALIEIGTNSVKLLVVHKKGRDISPDYERVVITRIGRNLTKTQRLDRKGIRQTLMVIKKFQRFCQKQGVKNIYVTGAGALREARDSRSFRKRLKKETGLSLAIISQKQEALYSYLSVKGRRVRMVIDIGGGTTEVAYGLSNKVKRVICLPLGAVKLTERFIHSDPISAEDYKLLFNYIHKTISSYKLSVKSYRCYGVGGTITTLTSIILREKRPIEGYSLSIGKVKELLQLFCRTNLKERQEIRGLEKGRADVILSGTAVLVCLMEALGVNRISVSTRGWRYGYLVRKLFSKKVLT